ncbi:hypothetical protein KR067_006642 [Drosophila pandora]|nr:hypothetical protein KR067_006642 [Drosophila pandora]
MTISEIANHSTKDEEIIDAMSCLECDSWKPGSLKQLYPFRYELSAIGALLLRGNRIVIPSLRNRVLELAHEGHPGESAMKRRLRSKVWWPLIDRKEEADKKRGAKDNVINVGDKVLLKNVVFPHKLTPSFQETEYVVVERNNNIVKLMSGNRTLTRNVSHVKKIPIYANDLEAPLHSSIGNTQPRITSTQEDHGDDERKGQQRRLSTDKLDPLPTKSLKLKLVKKGGMWEPATGGDVTNESGDAARERVKGSTDKSDLAVEE